MRVCIFLSMGEAVQSLWKTFDGFSGWSLPSSKTCQVKWSGPLQGHLVRLVPTWKGNPPGQRINEMKTTSHDVIHIDGYHGISWDINVNSYSNGLMDIELSKPSTQIIGHCKISTPLIESPGFDAHVQR